MRKPKTIKPLFDKPQDGRRRNYQYYAHFYASLMLPYLIYESNYTLKFDSEFCAPIQFLQNVQSKKAFMAGAKIKRDINATGLTPPDISKQEVQYYDFSPVEALKKAQETVFNIDIKSAYASVLKNHSLISADTYKYLTTLSKRDRLASVGMLASHKEIFEMMGHEAVSTEEIINEMENWFYFCVHQTNEIMANCAKILKNDFLFFWVDGIFYSSEKKEAQIKNYLISEGYGYKKAICSQFEYVETEQNRVLKYFKDGEELKTLSLPQKNKEAHEFLIKFLNFHS